MCSVLDGPSWKSGGMRKSYDAGVTRESGFLYFIDKGNVARSPMARGRK